MDDIEELAVSRQKFDEDSVGEMMEDVQRKKVDTVDITGHYNAHTLTITYIPILSNDFYLVKWKIVRWRTLFGVRFFF